MARQEEHTRALKPPIGNQRQIHNKSVVLIVVAVVLSSIVVDDI